MVDGGDAGEVGERIGRSKALFPWRSGGLACRSRLGLRSLWSTVARRAPMHPAAPPARRPPAVWITLS